MNRINAQTLDMINTLGIKDTDELLSTILTAIKIRKNSNKIKLGFASRMIGFGISLFEDADCRVKISITNKDWNGSIVYDSEYKNAF